MVPSGTAGTDAAGEAIPAVRERFWNLPNTITVLRLLIIPVLLVFPHVAGSRRACELIALAYVVATLSDLLDGWLARRWSQVTRAGQMLDPLSDKLVACTAFVVLLAADRIPAWGVTLVVVIIGRELAVTGLRSVAGPSGGVGAASGWGKLKSFCQNISVTALLLPSGALGAPVHGIGEVMLVVATALTVISGWQYFAAAKLG